MSPIVRPGEAFAHHDLARDDFPFTLIAFYIEGGEAEVVWAVTLIAPPAEAKALLKVPPLRRWTGRKIEVTMVPADAGLAILENAWS